MVISVRALDCQGCAFEVPQPTLNLCLPDSLAGGRGDVEKCNRVSAADGASSRSTLAGPGRVGRREALDRQCASQGDASQRALTLHMQKHREMCG